MPLTNGRRLLAAVLAIVCFARSDARAQSPLAIGFEEAFAPDFETRDLPVFRDDLHLDEGQTAVVESLLADYHQQFQQAMMAVRGDLRDVQALLGSEDPDVDRQREELREQISGLFEQMQEELENLPPGENPDDVRKRYEGKFKEIQQQLEGLRGPMMDDAQRKQALDDAAARLTAWNQQKRQLRDKLIGDAQAVLKDDQRPHWDGLERRLRRQKALAEGRLQGERVDVIALAGEMRFSDSLQRAIAPSLEDYAARLDTALRGREDGIQSAQTPLMVALREGDRAALQGVLKQLADSRAAVRDANDAAAAAVVAALAPLDEAQSQRFLQAYQQRGYSQVFRSTQAMRLFKAAQEIPGVTPEQIKAVLEMQKQLETELEAANQRLLAAVRQHEHEIWRMREELRLMPPGPEHEDAERDRGVDPIQRVQQERSEIGRRYSVQLEALLGPDLYERLPRGDRQRPGDALDADAEE
jgi:hypothetical protein